MHRFRTLSINQYLKWLIRSMIIFYSIVYLLLLVCSLLGISLSNYSQVDMVFSEETCEVQRFHPINWQHPFGTDYMGFDLFAQIYSGIKINFIFSFLAAVVFLIFGTIFGIRLGYYSKKNHEFKEFQKMRSGVESKKERIRYFSLSKIAKKIIYGNNGSSFLERVIYIFNSFPLILLVLLLVVFLNQVIRSTNVKLAIEMAVFGLFSAPRLSSMIIGKIKALRAEEFIQSSISLGLSNKQIIWKHILWNECRFIILFQTMYMMGQATILEITLTYLEFGAQAPWISWGNILYNMKSAPMHVYILFPITFVTLTIYMYMHFAEWLKEIDDKRNF